MIPTVVKMDVYPVAGHDSMELNLSGAHAPYFTRNIVILEDSNGTLGVGEVPGGQKITKALEDVKHLVLGTRIVDYKATLNKVREWLSANIKDDVRGLQTFDLRTGVHVVTAIEAPMLDLVGKFMDVPAAALMGDGFAASRMKGSQHNDPIGPDARPIKNGAGGANGGITNGAPIVFRVAFKPTSSIRKPQTTFNFEKGEMDTLEVPGRHDVCFALRTPPVVEAMTAIVLADLALLK